VLRQAVILVGGLGTRLGERTKTTPKPMLPVGGRPFLDTLIGELARYDVFDEILLLAGHKAESILARYDGTMWGRARLAVSLEQAPLGTAGALVHAAGRLQERFLLLNGDSFFDFNILDLVTRGNESLVHMALRADVVGDRFGRVALDGGRVRSFIAPGQGATGPVMPGLRRRSRIFSRRQPPRLPRAGHFSSARCKRRHDRNILSRLLHRHRHPRGFRARRRRTDRATAASGGFLRSRRRPQS
jgi:hypothetical protein